MRGGRQILACLFALLAFSSARAEAVIERFTLPNGMEAIVIPNHKVPAVAHFLWFRIGAADDPQGKSGLAHFHEHMMFRGTKAHAAGEYSRIITRHGGEHNAFTGDDFTGYYAIIAKEHLPVVMELEADRLGALMPDPKDALREREVIIEERRAVVENNPSALFSEQLDAALYLNHPYRVPVIGWKHEMAELSPEDVLAFHTQYYQPGNAVLVVVGDITAAELKPLAERYYGALPAHKVPARHWTKEPPARSPRHLSLHHAQVKRAELVRRYQAASLVDGETKHAMPLFVLAHLLGGEKTSFLHQALVVKEGIATSVGVNYSGFSLGPSTLQIRVIPKDGVTVEAAEAALDKALAAFLAGTIDAAELARTKTLMRAETIYARDGLQSIGYIVGQMVMLGLSPDFFNSWGVLAEKVTAEEIMEAARATLKAEASVTGYLLPEAKP